MSDQRLMQLNYVSVGPDGMMTTVVNGQAVHKSRWRMSIGGDTLRDIERFTPVTVLAVTTDPDYRANGDEHAVGRHGRWVSDVTIDGQTTGGWVALDDPLPNGEGDVFATVVSVDGPG